jgi:hypothetical protein
MRNGEANWQMERCKLGGSTGQNWEVNRCRSGSRIGGETMQYWQVNWKFQRCNIKVNSEVKRFRIGRGTGAILAGELGGRTMQNREVQGSRIGR